MHRPPAHPGDHLRDYLKANGYTPLSFALLVGIAPRHIFGLLHRRTSLTPRMAWVLGVVTDREADAWLALQAAWDENAAAMKTRPRLVL